jgi:RNA polymerase sigma-70 factor (ECF subfamily)
VANTLSLSLRGTDVMSSGDERQLVDRARAGDGLAFRRLVEPHLAVMYRIAARMSRNPSLAEDAVQEALSLAYQRLGNYRCDGNLRSFLAAFAARQAHTLARSERRRWRREERSIAPAREAGPEEMHHAAKAEEAVREALAQMPTKRREAVLLRLDAGLSHREIAEAIGSSEGSVRVLVHQALSELKAKLADGMGTLVDARDPEVAARSARER